MVVTIAITIGYENILRGKAQALVKFLTGYEAQVALYRNTGALPARRDAIEQFIAENPRWKAIGETLEYAKPYPSIPRWAKDIERDIVLDHFHSILRSIQKQEEWPVIEGQLKAAARELQPPPPWLIFFLGATLGVSLIVVGVLSAKALLGRRQGVASKAPPKEPETRTVAWSDLTLQIDVLQYCPIVIKLRVSGPHVPSCAEWTIEEPTAAFLVEGMRYGSLERAFDIWVRGHIVGEDAARAAIGRDLRRNLRNVIGKAIGGVPISLPPKPMLVFHPERIKKDLPPIYHWRAEHEFILGKETNIQSQILQAKDIVDQVKRKIQESLDTDADISVQELKQLLDNCIRAIALDPPSVRAWIAHFFVAIGQIVDVIVHVVRVPQVHQIPIAQIVDSHAPGHGDRQSILRFFFPSPTTALRYRPEHVPSAPIFSDWPRMVQRISPIVSTCLWTPVVLPQLL